MKIVFLLFICKIFCNDDFLDCKKNINKFFLINNAIGLVSLAALLSNHRVPKYFRIGCRIGSIFYFYNQYKYVDKAKLNYHFFHFYFPMVLNSAALLGEFFSKPHEKFLLSEILFSDFLLKNNTFFRIKKAIEIEQTKKNLKPAEISANEYINSLLSSFVSLDIPIYDKFYDALVFFSDCDYSQDYILLLQFDENHKVLINKKDQYDIKFYLFRNDGCFVSYIYFYIWQYILGSFFKTSNGEKGIGRKFFNWVIDFVRNNNCCDNYCYNCFKLFHLENIKLSTNKFLNKTALAIYRDKGFEITEENDNGEVKLELKLSSESTDQKIVCYRFDHENMKFFDNKSELSSGDCFEQFLKSISLERCNEYATKNKRIEFFVQQVLDYFDRFNKEESVDEINKNPQFLASFRNRCINEVESYIQFKGSNNKDYLEKLKASNKDELKIIENDSIENIEKDFREMIQAHDININNLKEM
jgi:hypothetical protein